MISASRKLSGAGGVGPNIETDGVVTVPSSSRSRWSPPRAAARCACAARLRSSRRRSQVSSVEAGRWDGWRGAESFAPAPQAAYPALRRMKNDQVRSDLAAGGEGRAVQGEVWREVAEKSARHGVRSHTGAMHDVFERHRTTLDAIAAQVTMKCSQVGMLAAIGGRFVVLDHVSDVEAFASLHGPLVQGYALDALEVPAALAPVTPSLDDARDFLALLLGGQAVRNPNVGLGDSLRFAFGGLAGTGLAVDGELVTLTAFAHDGDDAAASGPRAGRIRRPSRRAAG